MTGKLVCLVARSELERDGGDGYFSMFARSFNCECATILM